jgi:hypothetical protein
MNFKNNFKKELENIQADENIKENIFNNITKSPQFLQEEKVYPAMVKNHRSIFRPLVSFAACLAIVAGSVFVFSRTPWDKESGQDGALSEPKTSTTNLETSDKNSLTTPIQTRELFVYDTGWDSVVTLDVPEMPQYEFQVTPDSLSLSGRNLMIDRDVASITSVLIGDVNFDSIPEMYVTAALQPEYGSISFIFDFLSGKGYFAESVAISLDKKQQTANGLIVSKLSEDALPYTRQTEIPKDKILSEGTIVYDGDTGEFKFMDFNNSDFYEPLTHHITFYELGNPDYIDIPESEQPLIDDTDADMIELVNAEYDASTPLPVGADNKNHQPFYIDYAGISDGNSSNPYIIFHHDALGMLFIYKMTDNDTKQIDDIRTIGSGEIICAIDLKKSIGESNYYLIKVNKTGTLLTIDTNYEPGGTYKYVCDLTNVENDKSLKAVYKIYEIEKDDLWGDISVLGEDKNVIISGFGGAAIDKYGYSTFKFNTINPEYGAFIASFSKIGEPEVLGDLIYKEFYENKAKSRTWGLFDEYIPEEPLGTNSDLPDGIEAALSNPEKYNTANG